MPGLSGRRIVLELDIPLEFAAILGVHEGRENAMVFWCSDMAIHFVKTEERDTKGYEECAGAW